MGLEAVIATASRIRNLVESGEAILVVVVNSMGPIKSEVDDNIHILKINTLEELRELVDTLKPDTQTNPPPLKSS